jgi:hypothetical protein
MDTYAEGNYYWTVQGYAEESASGSGRTGLIARTGFTLNKEAAAAPSAPPRDAPPPKTAPAVSPPPSQPPVQPAVRPAAPAAPPAPSSPSLPPLTMATGRDPADTTVFNGEYFRSNTSIPFKWNTVNTADGYVFTLYRQDENQRTQVLTQRTSSTSFVFTDLSILARGNFVWSVEALRGDTLGPAGENRFTVDIPELKRNQLQDAGNMYGR